MEDVMGMMEENEEGHMVFQRDMVVEDCFSPTNEPLYGFMSNVTIPEEMLKPCLIDVECYQNGTSINQTESGEGNFDEDFDLVNLSPQSREPHGTLYYIVYFYIRNFKSISIVC